MMFLPKRNHPRQRGGHQTRAWAFTIFLGNRDGTKVELTGDQSVVLLRDYLGSLAGRGRASPAAEKAALAFWADALGIDWRLTDYLVFSAVAIDSGESPKQAPRVKISTLRALDLIALSPTVAPPERSFAA